MTVTGTLRHTTALFLLLAIGVALVLFSVKYQVQDLEEELTTLDAAIHRDREAIHVLEAEWSHLNDPERLHALAETHLGLEPLHPGQVGTFDGLPARPSLLDPAAAPREDGQ